MSNRNKSNDGANKGKTSESLWKRAFVSNQEWPDKVRFYKVLNLTRY